MTESDKTDAIKVLLVEDHLLTRLGLRAVLDRTGEFRVVGEAGNGEEALAKVAELCPDVVLMDVGLPVMDGIDTARKVCEQFKNVSVIMLTSRDREEDIFASLSAGASGYCLKDVAPERLYTAIRSVRAGDVWLDSNIATHVMKRYCASPSLDEAKQTNSGIPKPAELPKLTESLSQREVEVLALLVEGRSNQEIADKLIISLATAKTHVRNILNKLAVDDRTQAAVQAMKRGLV